VLEAAAPSDFRLHRAARRCHPVHYEQSVPRIALSAPRVRRTRAVAARRRNAAIGREEEDTALAHRRV
jgi:hypothetical protein